MSLPKGGYLIIEHTEALHVIDVNSGNKSNAGEDQEATAMMVNMEAQKKWRDSLGSATWAESLSLTS